MNKLTRRKIRNDPTPQEIKMWSRLRRKQRGVKFRRQHSIGKYIVDFYCPELRLAIEIDGWQHKNEFSQEKEKKRTHFIESNNITIIRFWNNEINSNIEQVVLSIERCISLRRDEILKKKMTTPQSPPLKEGK